MQKKKEVLQRSGRSPIRKTAIWAIMIPPLLIFAVFALFMCFRLGIIQSVFPDMTMQDSLSYNIARDDSVAIDIGLAILGIAVSVWVGINIYNIVSEDRVREIEYKLAEYQDTLESSRELKEIIQANEQDSRLRFLLLLSQYTERDEITAVFFETLSVALSSGSGSMQQQFINELNTIEDRFALMYEAHLKDNTELKRQHAEAGLRIMHECWERMQTLVGQAQCPWFNAYLMERKAEFYYYQSTIEGYVAACRDYKAVIEALSTAVDSLRIQKNTEYYRALVYLENSIAWSIVCIARLHKNDDRKKLLDVALEWFAGMEEHAENGILSMRATYWRNWGVCYENLGEYHKRYDIEAAKEAFAIALEKYQMASISAYKTKDYKLFATLCTCFFKLYDASSRPQNILSGEWWKLDYSLDIAFTEKLQARKVYLDFGKSIAPWFPDFYIQSIKYWTYQYYVSKNDPPQYYIEKVISDESILEIISGDTLSSVNKTVNRGRFYVLRDFYALLYQKTKQSKYLDKAETYNIYLNKQGDAALFPEFVQRWRNQQGLD